MSNVVTARLSSRDRIIETPPLYQYDYGQILQFTEIDLPATYEVHFGNSPYGNAVTVLGDENGVAIPDMYLTTGDAVHAWLFLHTGENDGETMYHVMIPVRIRPEVTDVPPTPVELSVITQTIAVLNSGVAHVDEVAAGMEQAITNALTEAKQSGEFDGFSPIVQVSNIQGGHRIVITDKNDEHTVDVLDGVKGNPGQDGYSPSISVHKVFHTTFVEVTDQNGTTETEIYDGDPSYLIDDSLYGRVLNRTWSIEKLWDTFIPRSDKGISGGLAELDQNGRVPASQLPSYVDDVVDGYLYNGHFYEDTEHQHEIIGESSKVYIDNNTNITYRWGGQSFVPIGSDLALGETSSTAYRGDRGKIAYDHANDQARVSIAHAKGLYKFGVTSQGHVQAIEEIAKADIVGLGIPGDVQIDGNSIVSNGVANIPKAANDTFGVVRANGQYGIDTLGGNGSNPGILVINRATSSGIKGGSSSWDVIIPKRQHESVFYGLSKAAGYDLANVQNITVGTYPAEAKVAIKTMLGLSDGVTFTPSVAANGDISWTNDGNRQNPATVNIKGPTGATGDSGVYYGTQTPTDPDVNVWIDPNGEPDPIEELKEAITDLQKDTTEADADLDITDENGNVIVRMIGGGVESKNFRGFKYITFSKSGTTSNQSIIITINRNFKKGDRIVLHCARGVYPYNAPWNQGLAVTYYEDNRVIVENERVDISYFEHIITADTSSVSVEYDGTLSSGSQTVTFSVSLMGDIPVTPTVLTVKKDGTGNYDNLRDAVDAIGLLANDVMNPYVIKVYPGTYDVLSDYTDEEINASVSSFSDITFVGLKLLNGVSLVGVGDPNDIILTASLDTTNYTADVRGGISTLNKQGSGSIENVTIVSNNLRYCFHDDFGSQSGKRIKRLIKNCIFRAYNSAYTPNTSYGAGMPVGGMDAEYIDCDFGENGGLHFNTQMLHAVSVHLMNCKGLGFRIGDNTTTTGYTEISEFKFDNCDFKWIGCVVADSTPHVCIRGTGNAPMIIKAPDGVLYDIDNVVVVPLERLNANVGDVVEWYAQNGHGPRYKAATSLDTASGIVVYKDSTDVYIQTSGYVKTSRAGISTFELNDYVGLSSGSAVVVQNESDSFGRIKYVDDDGAGYIELRWR